MAWGNEELARLFSEMAELLELTGETGFRVRAYDRGARALSGHGADLSSLSERELAAIPGVGKAIAAKVREYLDTGRVAKLEELRAQVPPGLRALVRVPGLGPAKARLVHERLGVSSPEELAGAVAAGRVAGLPGMGQRTEANLRRALERMSKPGDGIPLAVARPVAETLRDRLAGVAGVERVEVAGSLRRMKAAVHDIDLLAAATDPASVNRAFTELPQVAEVAALGDTKASVRTRDGLQVDLRTVGRPQRPHPRTGGQGGPQAQRVRPVRAGRRAGRGHRRGGRLRPPGHGLHPAGAARGPRRGRRRPPRPAPGAGQPGRRRWRLPLPHRPVA